MRRYETISIFRPGLSEEEINVIVENTGKIITDDKGFIIDFTKWGLKKMAYPIKKEIQGVYYYYEYAATPAAVAEIERKFRIDDSVLKYLTVKVADQVNVDEMQNIISESKNRNAALFNESAEEESDSVSESDEIEAIVEEE